MPGKLSEPFSYTAEPDGSVGFFHRWRGSYYHVGHLRASQDGGIAYSPTYEEPEEDFSRWNAEASLEGAILALMQAKIVGDDGHEIARIRSLSASIALIRGSVPTADRALKAAAGLAVSAAVTNMLRVATYSDVMKAVADAVASGVLGS